MVVAGCASYSLEACDMLSLCFYLSPPVGRSESEGGGCRLRKLFPGSDAIQVTLVGVGVL